MKITRKELLEIIDSSLSEQSTTNPGSRVRASASRGQTNEMDRNRKQAERELQRTVDWFEDTVFPALESNREVVADEPYVFAYADKGIMSPNAALIIVGGTKFRSPEDSAPIMSLGVGKFNPTGMDYTLPEIYQDLERQVLDFDLDVAMTSDAGEVERRIEDAPTKGLQADRMAQVDGDDAVQADIDRMAKDAGLDESTLKLTRRELLQVIEEVLKSDSRKFTMEAYGAAPLVLGAKYAGGILSAILATSAIWSMMSAAKKEELLALVSQENIEAAFGIYMALKGMGTDEEAVNRLLNAEDVPKIYADYERVLQIMGEDTAEDLEQWLRDDGMDTAANMVQDTIELALRAYTRR